VRKYLSGLAVTAVADAEYPKEATRGCLEKCLALFQQAYPDEQAFSSVHKVCHWMHLLLLFFFFFPYFCFVPTTSLPVFFLILFRIFWLYLLFFDAGIPSGAD
jgi:hypothetical protein